LVGSRPPGGCVGDSRLVHRFKCGVPHVAARRSATYLLISPSFPLPRLSARWSRNPGRHQSVGCPKSDWVFVASVVGTAAFSERLLLSFERSLHRIPQFLCFWFRLPGAEQRLMSSLLFPLVGQSQIRQAYHVEYRHVSVLYFHTCFRRRS